VDATETYAPRINSKGIMTQGKPSSKLDIISSNDLRITGGICKGTRLASPPVYLRPMMAKVP
jgi:hypothetical protein